MTEQENWQKVKFENDIHHILEDMLVNNGKDMAKGLREYLIREFNATKHQQDVAVEAMDTYTDVDATYEPAKKIIQLIKQAGHVKLAENQSLPKNPYNSTVREPARDTEGYQIFCGGAPVMHERTDDGHIGYAEAQQDMLKANFRKVKP